MAYADSIESLKSALALYSEDEKKLSELYKNAIASAESDYKASSERLNEQYKRDRNEVYYDTAKEERNTMNMLAKRGLGFSGEAAQTQLNSDIILANRLSALAREKNDSSIQLERELANRKSNISLESAAKQGELDSKRNQLRAEIANLELDKEQHDAELAAENERFNRQLAAENERYEREMAAQSLAAIFNNSSGNGSNKNESEEGYIPEITEKELARLLVQNAASGNKYYNTKQQSYVINKYLIDLIDNYDLNKEYYKNLVLILKSYGYRQVSNTKMRAQVVGYESEYYYDSQYEAFYNKYILNGKDERTAIETAKESALRAQLEFIWDKSRNEAEFRRFCNEVGIDNLDVQQCIERHATY